jgi:hypothetical protein
MTVEEACKLVMGFVLAGAGIFGLFHGYCPAIESSGQTVWVSMGLIVAGAGAVGVKVSRLLRNGSPKA